MIREFFSFGMCYECVMVNYQKPIYHNHNGLLLFDWPLAKSGTILSMGKYHFRYL
jgi:hypothetical protein